MLNDYKKLNQYFNNCFSHLLEIFLGYSGFVRTLIVPLGEENWNQPPEPQYHHYPGNNNFHPPGETNFQHSTYEMPSERPETRQPGSSQGLQESLARTGGHGENTEAEAAADPPPPYPHPEDVPMEPQMMAAASQDMEHQPPLDPHQESLPPLEPEDHEDKTDTDTVSDIPPRKRRRRGRRGWSTD